MKKVIFAFALALCVFCGYQTAMASGEEPIVTIETSAVEVAPVYIAEPVATQPVYAGAYVAPRLAFSFFDGDFKGMKSDNRFGVGGALAVGFDFNKQFDVPLRTELEYSVFETETFYEDNKAVVNVDNANVLMANFYYDYHNSTDFTPFIGFGVGTAFVESESNFTFGARAGVAYKVYENIDIELAYRYLDMGSISGPSYPKTDLTSQDIMLGVRYTF